VNDDDWGCGGVEAGAGSGWFGWGLGVSGSVCGGLDSRVAGGSAIVEIWGKPTNKKKKQEKNNKERSICERLVWFNMFFVLVLALDWALIFPCPRECVEGCNALYS
jgi:hypothetical protein